MYPNANSKPSDTGVDLYPIYCPTSSASYPPRSLCGRHTLGRHVKVASESFAHDFFRCGQPFPSPDPVDGRKYAMPEDEASSPDEDSDQPNSARYLVLAAKDRLRSASLEWILANGSVTPRVPHYHTHPPLDFKGLKKKLEQLTGSPDDANKKPFSGISGHDRRKGVVPALPATTADTNPTGGYSCVDAVNQTDQEVETKTAGASFLQNVPFVETERLSRTTSEEVDAKPIKITLSKTSMNQSANEPDSESVKCQWSDLAQVVAQKDERLQKLLKRHCQELEALKKKHELQWVELGQKISESVTQNLLQNDIPPQPEQQGHCFHKVALGTHSASTVPERIDNRPLLAPGVDPMPCSAGVSNVKQIVGRTLGNSAFATQSDACRVEEVDGKSMRKDFHRCIDGARNTSGVKSDENRRETGVPQHLPAQVRDQQATPSVTVVQRQMEKKASQPMEPHTWCNLVERSQLQMKNPPVQQQVESNNWYQMLEMFQRLQAAASLEHWIRQPVLRQVLQRQAIAEAQAQSAKFRSHRLPNRQCPYGKPCDLSQSFLPHFHEQSYPTDPYSVLDLTGDAGIGPAQVSPFSYPSFFQQSPCNEVSSYYYPENLSCSSICSSPDQIACLVEAARNSLLSASPALVMPSPPPMPLLSHLVARQSPLSFDLAHLSSLRSSPAPPLFSPRPVFQFSPTQTPSSDIRQLYFPPNPLAN